MDANAPHASEKDEKDADVAASKSAEGKEDSAPESPVEGAAADSPLILSGERLEAHHSAAARGLQQIMGAVKMIVNRA